MKRAQEEYDGYVKEHMRYKVTIFQLRGGELHYSQGGGGYIILRGLFLCTKDQMRKFSANQHQNDQK